MPGLGLYLVGVWKKQKHLRILCANTALCGFVSDETADNDDAYADVRTKEASRARCRLWCSVERDPSEKPQWKCVGLRGGPTADVRGRDRDRHGKASRAWRDPLEKL